jgi:tetratricopeptide (TPR) repeat protein
MRKTILLLLMLIAMSSVAEAQLVKSTGVPSGSDEDKALEAISAATDPAQKLVLIDKFMADFGQGNYAILANDLYVSYYSDLKNYAKMAEYSQKILAIDPENFNAALHLVRANSELGDNAGLFAAGEKMSGILTRYKAQTPPADTDAGSWNLRHQQSLADQKDQITYVQNLMVNVGYKTQAPAERAAFAERFVAAYPDSPYAAACQDLAAYAYQAMQNNDKMIATANKSLAMNPNDIDMLILLADYYSDRGLELDKADTFAKKAIDLMASAKKPEGMTDDQWKSRAALQTGIAWSAEGQVLINKNDLPGAAAAFQKASPLLKSEKTYYARNLYRLGFTYARQKKVPEATAALNEVISMDTPFKVPAQQTLQQLNGSAPPPKRTSHE